MSKPTKQKPLKKTHKQIVAEITEANRRQNLEDSNESFEQENLVKGATISTKQLESQVLDSLKENLKGNGLVIKGFQLVHFRGVKYSGTLTVLTAQGVENCKVDVTFDGKDFVWQLVDEQAQPAKRPVGLFLLSLGALIFAIAVAVGCMPYSNKIILTMNIAFLILALGNFWRFFSAVILKQ